MFCSIKLGEFYWPSVEQFCKEEIPHILKKEAMIIIMGENDIERATRQ